MKYVIVRDDVEGVWMYRHPLDRRQYSYTAYCPEQRKEIRREDDRNSNRAGK